MGFKGVIENIYFNRTPVGEKEKRRGRKLFILEGVSARTIFVLTSGAYLAGFANLMGADDSFNGLIGAVPALAGIIQILSPMVFENLSRRKIWVSIFSFIHRLLLGGMVFIPLLVTEMSARLYTIWAVYFISYACTSFATPAASNWIVSLTDPRDRGGYFGTRDSIIFGVSTVFNLIMGRVLDVYKNNGMEYTGFILVFSMALVFAVINFLLLSSIKEPPAQKSATIPNLKEIFTVPLHDKKFKKVIGLFLMWNIGLQIGAPFFSVYMVTGLNLGYTYITICNMITSVFLVVSARLWGKLADRTSWPTVTMATIGILALCHSIWFFTTPANVYILMPINQILGGIAWGGINIALFNMQFDYSPEKGRTVYLGFNAAIGGIVGFACSALGSYIVKLLDGRTFQLLMVPVTKMQVVFGLSGILLFACAFYIRIVFKNSVQKDLLMSMGKDTIQKAVQKVKGISG